MGNLLNQVPFPQFQQELLQTDPVWGGPSLYFTLSEFTSDDTDNLPVPTDALEAHLSVALALTFHIANPTPSIRSIQTCSPIKMGERPAVSSPIPMSDTTGISFNLSQRAREKRLMMSKPISKPFLVISLPMLKKIYSRSSTLSTPLDPIIMQRILNIFATPKNCFPYTQKTHSTTESMSFQVLEWGSTMTRTMSADIATSPARGRVLRHCPLQSVSTS